MKIKSFQIIGCSWLWEEKVTTSLLDDYFYYFGALADSFPSSSGNLVLWHLRENFTEFFMSISSWNIFASPSADCSRVWLWPVSWWLMNQTGPVSHQNQAVKYTISHSSVMRWLINTFSLLRQYYVASNVIMISAKP